MTTIGLSYSLVKISTKCAPALLGDRGFRRPPAGFRTYLGDMYRIFSYNQLK